MHLLMPGGAVNHLAVFSKIIAVPETVNHSLPLMAKCLVGCRLASLEFYMHDTSRCTTKTTQIAEDSCHPHPGPSPQGCQSPSGQQG